jgi:hypothetical protein
LIYLRINATVTLCARRLHSVTKEAARNMTQQTEDPVALQRRANATIAALTRAAQTDGREISAPARNAFLAKFETQHHCRHCGTITIDQSLPPDQRARAVKAAITLHFRRLAAVSVAARSTMTRLDGMAAAAEEQLRAELGELDDEC